MRASQCMRRCEHWKGFDGRVAAVRASIGIGERRSAFFPARGREPWHSAIGTATRPARGGSISDRRRQGRLSRRLTVVPRRLPRLRRRCRAEVRAPRHPLSQCRPAITRISTRRARRAGTRSSRHFDELRSLPKAACPDAPEQGRRLRSNVALRTFPSVRRRGNLLRQQSCRGRGLYAGARAEPSAGRAFCERRRALSPIFTPFISAALAAAVEPVAQVHDKAARAHAGARVGREVPPPRSFFWPPTDAPYSPAPCCSWTVV